MPSRASKLTRIDRGAGDEAPAQGALVALAIAAWWAWEFLW